MKNAVFSLLLVLALGGCTTSPLALKVLYGQFDNVMKRELLSYADFNDAERQAIKEEVDKLVAWHRYQALPSYVDLINEAQSRLLDSPAELKDIDWLFLTTKRLAQEFEARSPVLSLRPMIAQLDDRQINQVIAKIAEKLAEEKKELEETAADPMAESVKNLTKFFKRLGVKLNNSQQRLAQSFFEQRSLTPLQRHAAWEAWSAELTSILKNRQTPEFPQQLEAHYTARFSLIEKSFPIAWQQDQIVYKELFNALFNSLDAPQKQAMRERLASLSAVATDLASQD